MLRDHEYIKLNISFFLPFFVFLLIGAAALILTNKGDIFLFINQHNHPLADSFFQYINFLGDGIFYILVIIIFLFIRYYHALLLLTSYLASALTVQFLKRIVFSDCARPIAYFSDIAGQLHLVDGLDIHSYNSFPSGHAASAFSLFCLLAILSQKKHWGWIYFCLAFLAAFSRIYLAQHFFIDVYFGSIIGVSASILVHKALEHSSFLQRSVIQKGSLLSS